MNISWQILVRIQALYKLEKSNIEKSGNSLDLYTSQNSFRKKPKTILSEYNCNQDLVFEKTKNQIGFSIFEAFREYRNVAHKWCKMMIYDYVSAEIADIGVKKMLDSNSKFLSFALPVLLWH